MSQTTTPSPLTPQGPVPAINIPNSQDYPRLVFSAPYFEQVPLAELIEPSVIEAIEAALPSLVPPYVQDAANQAVQQLAVLKSGSSMTGPLFLSPVIPTQPSQAASMQYVDTMLATAGIPEVPPIPYGQLWGRETGQWVPIAQSEGVFLPLTGGTMQGILDMGGFTINDLGASPIMPNGAAPAQWVLDQMAQMGVTSFNDRIGAVALELSDITNAGGAPVFSPALQGLPTSTEPPLTDNSYRIATTNWVWGNMTAANMTVSPPLLGQTNLQALLASLTALVTAQMQTFTQDANGAVSPAALPNATVVMSGDMSGTATDTTGTANSMSMSGDATTA
jgi:hypothetical protein